MTATQIIVSLGFFNVLIALALYFSCRCWAMEAWGKALMKRRWFQQFFKFHCYLWWILGASVIAHAILAIRTLGWPF